MLINKARFARPCVEPIGRLKTTFHRAQRGVYSSRMCVYLLFPFPKHTVVCMVLFPFPKHTVERRECEGTFRFPHYLICPNVIQFLHIGVHSKVPHTIEQHAKIQGTSSSGGIEQAQIKHIK